MALEEVSLNLEKGKIYGFIGQNGAGKTTLMRILTGLAFPTEGRLEIFGKSGKKDLESARKRIGCLIEQVAMSPNLTVRQNLEFHRILKGITDKEAADSLLTMVGLEDQAQKKFANLSLGMKQRLGIASALLGNPELLILDEPINGLDPVGIMEVRELLSKLNREYGVTILISSHILSELYMLATDYIMIHQGKIVERLTLEELSSRCKKKITIESDSMEEAKVILKDKLGITEFAVDQDRKICFDDDEFDRRTLAHAFHQEGVVLTELSYQEQSLEAYFVQTIGGERQ